MMRDERIMAVNVAVRALFEMPEYPVPITNEICLHCVMSGPNEGHDEKAKEFCTKLTAILRENGVDPLTVVDAARREGVTNFHFENNEVLVMIGIRRFLPLDPPWHRVLSFDLLMEIVARHA